MTNHGLVCRMVVRAIIIQIYCNGFHSILISRNLVSKIFSPTLDELRGIIKLELAGILKINTLNQRRIFRESSASANILSEYN